MFNSDLESFVVEYMLEHPEVNVIVCQRVQNIFGVSFNK